MIVIEKETGLQIKLNKIDEKFIETKSHEYFNTNGKIESFYLYTNITDRFIILTKSIDNLYDEIREVKLKENQFKNFEITTDFIKYIIKYK